MSSMSVSQNSWNQSEELEREDLLDWFNDLPEESQQVVQEELETFFQKTPGENSRVFIDQVYTRVDPYLGKPGSDYVAWDDLEPELMNNDYELATLVGYMETFYMDSSVPPFWLEEEDEDVEDAEEDENEDEFVPSPEFETWFVSLPEEKSKIVLEEFALQEWLKQKQE